MIILTLTAEQFKREADYHLAKAIFKKLLHQGLLTASEYKEALRRINNLFNPVWSGMPDLVCSQLSV